MAKLISTLFEVKIISILLTGVFCYLSIVGRIGSDVFISIFLMIVSFYFGQDSMKSPGK